MNKFRKFIIIAVLSLTGLCLIVLAISAVSNLSLPRSSSVVATLSEADKIRLAEAIHLRQEVGDAVWPGWGKADIPAIAYNESYAFLVGLPDPADGWVKVPAGIQRGGPWELVPDDTFFGAAYYRQRLPDADTTPEAFTVQVGERWAMSMQTLDWMKIGLKRAIQSDLPGVLSPVFPYRLFIGQLVSGSDQYISILAHETFHAYEGTLAPDRLAEAEQANTAYESQYPWDDPPFKADWQAELDLLASALKSTDREETVKLVRQFIDQRAVRRERAGLSAELIAYEQNREWLEGLARYAELEIWRQAYSRTYAPLPETKALSDFSGYSGIEHRWSLEIRQITMMAGDEGDGRFYYTGMAQAFLLDRFIPDWKTKAFEEGVWLEDLLAEIR